MTSENYIPFCCCCSFTKLCLTLVDPWTAACQAPLSFTVSRSFFALMSIEPVMPSNTLLFRYPLSVFLFVCFTVPQIKMQTISISQTHHFGPFPIHVPSPIPRGNCSSDFQHHKWVLPDLESHINRITRCVLGCVWLFWLNIYAYKILTFPIYYFPFYLCKILHVSFLFFGAILLH